MRRPRREVLIGGAPIRVLRLTPAGADMVDGWMRRGPVGASPGAQALARRLLDAGLAHPDRASLPSPPSEDWPVVIPVRDQPAELAATLAAVGRFGPSVTVVDDGSTPAVRAADVAPAALIRRGEAGGPGAARNRGWRAAEGEAIVFLDAGCVPGPGWLEQLSAHLSDPAVGAVAPRVVSAIEPGAPGPIALYERRRSRLDMGPRPAPVRPGSRVPFVPAAALVVRRAALEAVGGFDESLRYGEDVDLVWRLYRAGWSVRYEPAATVAHPARSNLRAWLEQRYRYGSSAAPLAARHHRDLAPLTVSPWSVAAWGLAACGHPGAGVVIAGGASAVLARRAGPDAATASALAGLAWRGTVGAGSALAAAIRTAWLPPAWLATGLAPSSLHRRGRVGLAAAFLLPALSEWLREPGGPGGLPLPTWVGLRLADDLAYQAGVWSGVWRGRSAGALLPRW